VPQAHDRLFRRVFSDPEQACGELQHLLPAVVSAQIDWRSLELVPGSFVDQALSERRSDVLFTVQLGGQPFLLYLLLEHQSTADPLMPFRLLSYMVRIWDEHLERNPQARLLPAIAPLVVHHSERGWTAPKRFEQILALPEDALEALRPNLPSFELLLDDLSVERDEALRERVLLPALAKLSLLCLKWSRQSPDIFEELRRSASLVEEVSGAPNGVAALSAIVSYLLEVSDATPQKVGTILRQLGPKTGEAVMTFEQYFEEKGRVQGEARGEARAILKILERRGIALSDAERERVGTCQDLLQLDAWLEHALAVSSASELFS